MSGRVVPLATVTEWLGAHPEVRLIGIAGIPGAGKSTLAARWTAQFPGSACVPMDGYHLPRASLDEAGLRRRGAAHTFDAIAFRTDLERLRQTGAGRFPGWSHVRRDPEPDAVRIGPEITRVFVEGLYLLMASWQTAPLFDVRIFLECELATAMSRVEQRSLDSGAFTDREAARRRVESNDRLNAEAILADGGRERADFVISAW